MSLDALSATINEKRDKAETLRTTLKGQIEHIRNDQTRTGMGKKSLIAGLLRDTQQKIKQIEDDEVQAIAAARTKLEREVFGTTITDPTGILAYRDAQQRAADINHDDHDKAQELLRTAALSNDHTLASAVLSKAFHWGWTDLIDNYKQNHPERATKLDDLLKLDRWSTDDEESFSGRYGAYFIGTPDELRGTHEAEINRLAKGNGAPAVTTGGGQVWGVS